MRRRAAKQMSIAWTALLAPLALGFASSTAMAASVDVRSGSHGWYGRIVIESTDSPHYQMQQDGNRVTVRFDGAVDLQHAPKPPRNVLSIQTDGQNLSFEIAAGTSIRPAAVGGCVVFDVLDPGVADGAAKIKAAVPPQRPPPTPSILAGSPELGGRQPQPPLVTAATAAAAPPPAIAAEPAPVVAQPLSPAADQPDEALPAPTQAEAPGRDVLPENAGPLGLRARRTKLPHGLEGSAFVVPFADTTGAAVFQHNGGTLVVFDERRPVDMAALRGDPIFGGADIQLLPSGTLLRLPDHDGVRLALSHSSAGWRIAGLKTELKMQPVLPSISNGALKFPVEQPGTVISMADPDTGALLLIGTLRQSGQAVPNSRRTTEFILRPTGLGIVVEPLSDAIALKAEAPGFTITGGPNGLAISPQTAATEALMDAAHLTRRLDFSGLPADALMRRMITQVDDAAMTRPLARGAKREAAAKSMMALGMNAEAEALLEITVEQDPKEAGSADVVALKAIAALLAGRTSEADGLNDPRLNGTDDIALWRAVRQAMQNEGSPAAAAVFASTAPLALLYPKPIRDRIVPPIIETMIEGGQIPSAARLLARHKDDRRLDYARALLQQANGNTDQALVLLDGLANGHDQFDRARGAVRATELRLSSGKITASEAADAMDKLVYAWRGDQRELALRERIAALREQAGAWRVALSTLRQAEADFPEQAVSVHDQLKDAFGGIVAGHGLGKMTPIDVVAAIDENADLMSAKGGDPLLEEQLADRLLALDLPERARPVLDKLMKTAASPAGKARFGATLAALDAQEKDDVGALAALDASEGSDLPAALAEKRLLLRANIMARAGDTAGATTALATLSSPAAIEARATILEQAQDWSGAEKAWSDYASTILPDAGPLDDRQATTLLRLTTAAARAGDEATLASLQGRFGGRLANGALADMFRLLTTEPVRGTGDLKRVRQEVSLAQSLPASLKALGGIMSAH